MAQLFTMSFLHRFIEPLEEPYTSWSDAPNHRAPVPCLSRSRDQLAFFQPVQQSSDVRVSGNHAFGNLSARKAFWCAPQDTQHVILRCGHILAFENVQQA